MSPHPHNPHPKRSLSRAGRDHALRARARGLLGVAATPTLVLNGGIMSPTREMSTHTSRRVDHLDAMTVTVTSRADSGDIT